MLLPQKNVRKSFDNFYTLPLNASATLSKGNIRKYTVDKRSISSNKFNHMVHTSVLDYKIDGLSSIVINEGYFDTEIGIELTPSDIWE